MKTVPPLLSIVLLFCSPLKAAELSLALESETIRSGQATPLILTYSNFGDSEERVTFPSTINLSIRNANGEQLTQAVLLSRAAANNLPLEPYSSLERLYQFTAPEDLSGPVVVDYEGSRLLASIRPNENDAATTQTDSSDNVTESPKPAVNPLRELNHNPHLFSGTESDLLSIYEPLYFDIGASEFLNSKFQLSFKHRLFSTKGALAGEQPWASNLFFRYTQTSLWDLESDSAPFIDTSYKPGFFYLHEFDAKAGALKTIESGYFHESNGKAGEDSRSTNYLYVKPMFQWEFANEHYLSAGARIWAYLSNDDSTNADIAEYWGYADALIAFGKNAGYQLAFTGRIGDEWDKGRIQIEFFYPLHNFAYQNMPFYLHLSYFNGYGESLLYYDQKGPAQFRIGFSMSQY